MSKINAVRIINLNYNNNSMKVSDETFQMGGKSTLLSLRNGGGKSVMVQMMTAPFVHKQYRKTKDRPFESYFTTAKPTFIMVEWKLDHGAGYCLTGMMVRRSQVTEEQSSEPLEIINFISEYSRRCDYDIYHIPVVEKSKKEIVLKGYGACKQLFEEYKKDKSMKFFYYDMNHYAQSKQYFDKLEEYQIYYKEWETIIHELNVEESGLSKLFSDCKNESGLVEKWFLRSIENKLNREKNRMKEFQAIIEKYVISVKDNKSKIDRVETIKKFKEDMVETETLATDFLEAEKQVKALENRIACFKEKLNELEQDIMLQKGQLEEEMEECEEKLAHALYEKFSSEIYELQHDLRNRISNRDMIQIEMDAIENERSKIEKLLHIYNCAKQQAIVDEYEKNVHFYSDRIQVLKNENSDYEPERKRIGGYLHMHYQEEEQNNQNELNQLELEYDQITQKKQQQKEKEEQCQQDIQSLIGAIERCKTRIEGFVEKEDAYNNNYQEEFCRNIIGDYEPGFLEIKEQEYAKEKSELDKKIVQQKCTLDETREMQRQNRRELENTQNLRLQHTYELQDLEKKALIYDEEIKERLRIMKYFDVNENQLWNKEKLLNAAEHKISECDRNCSELLKEENALQKEWKKLASGELLELPQDFKEMLEQLDLHPVMGMDWLDRNGNSAEQNAELVKNNPFIPYALILSKQELRVLEQQGKEIYTSFPIPIVPREELNQKIGEHEIRVLELSGVSFYLWFNEKLLDKDALQAMLHKIEEKIKAIQNEISRRKEEYQDFLDKRSVILKQEITKELVEKNRTQQNDMQDSISRLETQIILQREELDSLLTDEKELMEQIQSDKELMLKFSRRELDFLKFCNDYELYQNDKLDVEKKTEEKSRYEEMKKMLVEAQNKCEESIKTLDTKRQAMQQEYKIIQEKLALFCIYDVDEEYEPDISKTQIAQLEERYRAITEKMSSQLADLEFYLQQANTNVQKAKTDLLKKQNKYLLQPADWASIEYNEKEEVHQEVLLEDKNKKIKVLERTLYEEEKQIAVVQSKIDDRTKHMKEQCGHDEPIPKEEIMTMDFDAKKNQLEYQKKELMKEHEKLQKKLQSVEQNTAAFAEYMDFVVEEEVAWEQDIACMDEKELMVFSGMMRRDYNAAKDDKRDRMKKVESLLNRLLRKEAYEEEYYKKPLENMMSVIDSASLVLSQIATTVQAYDSQLAKLAIDIAMVDEEKNRIEGLLEDYVKDVHENMSKIDNNSTINIRQRPVKMLKIQLPIWEENEALYHQRLDDFMNEMTEKCIEIYERNENSSDYYGSRITTKNLYDTIVGIGNVQIKLYKIEEQREYPITWSEVAKNSGGEGFLSAFVILSSLLHYMRRDDTDIFADKNEGKILVMDNPFAQTNASHLLKPLMDIAKKTNTQLICLSGLGGDSIYNCFDNIYVLNLVAASLQGGVQYLKGERARGVDEEVMVSSHIEVIGQQSLLF